MYEAVCQLMIRHNAESVCEVQGHDCEGEGSDMHPTSLHCLKNRSRLWACCWD